jgi:hypothetical protein
MDKMQGINVVEEMVHIAITEIKKFKENTGTTVPLPWTRPTQYAIKECT